MRSPWRIRPRVSTTSTALLGNRPCGEGGRGLHEMNPCLFQSPAGAASTFEPFLTPVLATLYTAPSRSFGVRWFHRLGLTDSHGSHPLWALPRLNLPAVSGSLSHPLRDRHAPRYPCTVLVPAMPRWRRPDASISAIASHRVLLALAHPSLWDHPLSMVLVYHTR